MVTKNDLIRTPKLLMRLELLVKGKVVFAYVREESQLNMDDVEIRIVPDARGGV